MTTNGKRENMRGRRVITVRLAACLLTAATSSWTTCGTAAEEAVFVEKGNARSVFEVGSKWKSKKGSMAGGGMGNYLVAERAVGTGEFRIRARLSLERLDGTAASLAFGQNHFGFDGRGGKLFAEGAALGSTRSVSDTADFIVPGRPFDVEVVRQGSTVTFRIDGKDVHQGEYRLNAPLAVALRPWQATMAVSSFSASGNLVDVTDDAVAKLREDWKQPARWGNYCRYQWADRLAGDMVWSRTRVGLGVVRASNLLVCDIGISRCSPHLLFSGRACQRFIDTGNAGG